MGVLVVVRPDHYVAHVLPLEATAELVTFFAGSFEAKGHAPCEHGGKSWGQGRNPVSVSSIDVVNIASMWGSDVVGALHPVPRCP